MRILLLFIFISVTYSSLISQKNVGIGTTTPDPTAALDIESTDKGILIPRVTTSQRTMIGGGSPATGLLVYDTDKSSFYFYDGTDWVDLSAGSPDTDWTETPSEVYTTKNVGIGINNPNQLLEVGSTTSTSNYIRISSINTRPNGIDFVRAGSSNDWRWQNSNSFFDLYKVTNDFTSAGIDDILATFSAEGRLGIGTYDPQSELHVVGGIRSSDLESSGNRPVFADPNGELVLTAPAPTTKYWSCNFSDFNSDHPNFVFGPIRAYISSASGFQPGIFASLHLPDGAVINTVIFEYDDNDPDNNITLQVKRDSPTLTEPIASFQSTGTPGNGIRNLKTISETVDNWAYSYKIEVYPNGNWSSLIGVRGIIIGYTLVD